MSDELRNGRPYYYGPSDRQDHRRHVHVPFPAILPSDPIVTTPASQATDAGDDDDD